MGAGVTVRVPVPVPIRVTLDEFDDVAVRAGVTVSLLVRDGNCVGDKRGGVIVADVDGLLTREGVGAGETVSVAVDRVGLRVSDSDAGEVSVAGRD